MLSLSLALLSTLPLDASYSFRYTLPFDANNCTILTTSSCVNGGSSPLGPLRNASLSCLRRFADATSDFGTRDNEKWAEYAPTCAVWDGVPFGVAEPLNAFSALAYDELLCVANLSFVHTALQLWSKIVPPWLCLRSGYTPPLAPDSRWLYAPRGETGPQGLGTQPPASGA